MTTAEMMTVKKMLNSENVYDQEQFDKLTQEQREYIFQHSEYDEFNDCLHFEDVIAVELTRFLLQYFTLDVIESRYKAVFGEEYSKENIMFHVALCVCGSPNYDAEELAEYIYSIYPEEVIGEDEEYDGGYYDTNFYCDDMLECLSEFAGEDYSMPAYLLGDAPFDPFYDGDDEYYGDDDDGDDDDDEDLYGESAKTFWESHGI